MKILSAAAEPDINHLDQGHIHLTTDGKSMLPCRWQLHHPQLHLYHFHTEISTFVLDFIFLLPAVAGLTSDLRGMWLF